MMRRSGKTNYAYAAARVQAKRAKLVPDAEYDKLLKMDVSEITRFIQDSHYKAEVDELSGRFGGLDLLEAALTVNQERTNQSVRKMLDGAGGDLVNRFLMRHLKEDIKTVLRGKNAGATRDNLLRELLLEDLDTYNVFQALMADDIRTPTDVAAALVRQGGVAAEWGNVLNAVPAESELAAYEDALDKAYFGRLLPELEDSKLKGSDLMLEFLKREVDVRNLQNVTRWVHAKQEGDVTPYLIPGGKSLRVRDLVDLARAGDLSGVADRLADLKLDNELVDALRAAGTAGRLAPFQIALGAWHAADLRKLSHQAPLSIVPILLFLLQKDHEVRRLRALARGRQAALDEARLKELVMAA